MPTRILAAKQPARKKPVGKPAAKKAVAVNKPAAKARQRPVKVSADDLASLSELATRLGELELAGLAGKFVKGWRADVTAIVEANRSSYAGLQAMARRQVKDAVGELQTVGKVMATVGAKESVRNLNGLALASLQLALADIRELAVLAANSQRATFEIVHGRATKAVEKVQQLLRK
jgi:hypothetical protein